MLDLFQHLNKNKKTFDLIQGFKTSFTMYLEIVTPEASLVSGEVESVTVPGVDGEFQMLSNHAAIVSSLQKGNITFIGAPTITEGFEDKFTKDKDGKWSLAINSGTLEMKDNKAIILAD